MMRAQLRSASIVTSARPRLEALEDRCLLATTVLQTNLVSDLSGLAQHMDTHLVNPWGISEGTSGPFWVSDNNAGVSTLYDSQGNPQSLVVGIPTPGNPTGTTGTPTGTVFNITLANATPGFVISQNGSSGPAVFLFATEDGTIAGWSPDVNANEAVIAVDHSTAGAVYKGLTIATDANGQTLLYAANFRSGKIEVFDTSFSQVTPKPGAFKDPNLPEGYAPFNVQVLGNKLYVTYAKQNAAKHDNVDGPGRGYVDVYNLDGTGRQRLISRGTLDSPWGLAIAPASFGTLAGALLVGNFGNGHIHAFNGQTGTLLGELKDPTGAAIHIEGLWALQVGNGNGGGDANTVYFTAGIDHEHHGLFGSLAPAQGSAEGQTVTAAQTLVKISTIQKDVSAGIAGAQLRQSLRAFDDSLIRFNLAQGQSAIDRDGNALAREHHGVLTNQTQVRDGSDLDVFFANLGDLGRDGLA
jgi:uncharacterized protein (TIGR03118 family)